MQSRVAGAGLVRKAVFLLAVFALTLSACATDESDEEVAEPESDEEDAEPESDEEDAEPESDEEDAEPEVVGSRYEDYEIPEEFDRLVLAGGRDGSSASLFWTAASELWNRDLGMNTSVQSSDGVQNGLLLEAGEVFAAVNNPSALGEATGRDDPLDGTNIRTMWNMFSVSWTIVADADIEAQQFSDLAGTRVVIGPGPEAILFDRALECAGLTRDDFSAVLEIGKEEGAAAFRDGEADAMAGWLGPIPMGQATELITGRRGATIVPAGEDIVSCLSDTPFYVETVIPADAYEDVLDSDIASVSEWFYAAVSDELPTELVYNMARVLDVEHDELVSRFAGAASATAENTANAVGFDLHPGLKEYLEDIGELN